MARRKKKDSHAITKGYGPRYGVRVRKRIDSVLRTSRAYYQCPECRYVKVKRVSVGIWKCRHCDLVFAGAAFQPTGRKTKIGIRDEDRLAAEDDFLAEEIEIDLEGIEPSRIIPRDPRPEDLAPEEPVAEEEEGGEPASGEPTPE